MMARFYLVRHGQIERGVGGADPPLSSQGRAEAHAVAAYLAPKEITHLYASPLRRAKESAVPLATRLALPVVVEPRLRERINFGDLPTQSFADFAALWERCNRERDFVPPIGDSSRVAGKRVENFLAELYAASPHGKIAAFTHGGVIADFLLNICASGELAQLFPAFAAQPYSGEVMRNCAVTVVDITRTNGGAENVVVEAIALTDHLPAI
jgi:broad specificity phosphatase PhoE